MVVVEVGAATVGAVAATQPDGAGSMLCWRGERGHVLDEIIRREEDAGSGVES